MERITSEDELEERLSRPSDADIHSLHRMDGDLLILGAGGKMGPSLAVRAVRATKEAGISRRVIAVARFSDSAVRTRLATAGVEIIAADLLAPSVLASLPDAPNVIYMAAKKFGTTGNEYTTWAMNAYLPGLAADRFKHSRIVAFSTGNVYPLRPVNLGGASEQSPVGPEGEYGQSALARERIFEYGSRTWGTRAAILRLNYAVELRYGVLTDIATKVFERRPVDLSMGLVNVIWQGDANSVCLRSFEFCETPPRVLNLTGPETLSVRYLAEEFGRRFDIDPIFEGAEASTALLNNSALAHRLFGYPAVSVHQAMDWVASWIQDGYSLHGKPTHFQVADGKF